MTFIPQDYKLPTSGSSNYMRLQDGPNKFRVLSSAIVGYEYWNNQNKPIRSKHRNDIDPTDIRRNSDGEVERVKHFWAFVVWNYSDSKVQILQLTQSTIMEPMLDLIKNPDWGDPHNYDITVTRTGSKLDTTYSIIPSPSKPFTNEEAKNQATKVNLEALYDGGDPFKEGIAYDAIKDEDSPFS